MIHDRCHRRKPQILCPYSVFGNSRWLATLLFPDVHHSIKGETKKPNKNHSFFIKNKFNNEGRLHYFLNIIFIIMYLIYYLPYKILNDGSCTNSNKVIIDKKDRLNRQCENKCYMCWSVPSEYIKVSAVINRNNTDKCII